MDIETVKEECTTIDGFDDAILGMADVDNEPHAIYSLEMMVRILIERDEMTEEDAREYIDYNVVRSLAYFRPSPILVQEILHSIPE